MAYDKVLINEKKKFLVKDASRDFHTQFGFISKEDLSKEKGVVKTNKGEEFFILNPTFRDLWGRLKRGPQTIRLKDVGIIITELGINKKSFVLDAGTGSGSLALILATIAKKVVSYEKREEFFKIAEENKKMFGLKNLIIKNKDVLSAREKNIDAVTLDLPEPFNVIKHLTPRVKVGAFISTYLPQIDQVKDLVKKVEDHNKENKEKLIYIKTVEILEREWIVDNKRLRPKNIMLGHTAFISFFRRVL